MTLFGKVLIGLMLATAAVLVIKGSNKSGAVITADTAGQESGSTTPVAINDSKFSGSMAELASRGGNHKCTFDQTTEVSHSTGTVLISGAKLRGDFVSEVKAVTGMKVESHMISDGQFIYTWSSMMPQGMKFAVSANVVGSSTTSGTVAFGQTLDYDCQSWIVDESVFTLPDGITFTEVKS